MVKFGMGPIKIVGFDLVTKQSRYRADVQELLKTATTIEELAAAFDLSTFPLPMRVGVAHTCTGWCFCPIVGGKLFLQQSIKVFMKVKPRSEEELTSVERDKDGLVELNTATDVSERSLKVEGVEWAFEKVRMTIKNLVMHEVYEALMFKGARVLDPHDIWRRPSDQPF